MDEIRLLNYLKGELSEEEILQVEAWYEASPDNKKMLEQLYYTMFIGERAAVMESVDVEKSLNRLKTAIKRKENPFCQVEALCISISCFFHRNRFNCRSFLYNIK